MATQPKPHSYVPELERQWDLQQARLKAQQAKDEEIHRLIRERAQGPDRLSTILAAYDVLSELGAGNAAAVAAAPSAPAGTPSAMEAPRFSARDAERSVGERAMRGADQFVRSVARGIPLIGTGMDEFAAAGDAIVGHYVGMGSQKEGWNNRYRENLAAQRARDKEFDASYPVTSTIGKSAGAVLGSLAMLRGASEAGVPIPVPAATFGGRMGQYTAAGAAVGAPTGFFAGEDGLDDRLRSALLDIAIGAVTAPGVGATLEGAAALARHGGKRLLDLRRSGEAESSPVPASMTDGSALQRRSNVSSGIAPGKERIAEIGPAGNPAAQQGPGKREVLERKPAIPELIATMQPASNVLHEASPVAVGKAPHIVKFNYQPPPDLFLGFGNPQAEMASGRQFVLPFAPSTAPVSQQSARAIEQMNPKLLPTNERGYPMGGEFYWYNGPSRAAFLNDLGPDGAAHHHVLKQLIAATNETIPEDQANRIAHLFYNAYMRGELGSGKPAANVVLPPGFGHPRRQSINRAIDQIFDQGFLDPIRFPKTARMEAALNGNLANAIPDRHFVRGLELTTRTGQPRVSLRPQELPMFQAAASELAERLGTTPAQLSSLVFSGSRTAANPLPFEVRLDRYVKSLEPGSTSTLGTTWRKFMRGLTTPALIGFLAKSQGIAEEEQP